MNRDRLSKFKQWWKKNHHSINAHMWLTKHSKRLLFNYNTAPEQFDQAMSILKRFNLSEYKRLNKADAQFLWRLTHPTMNERRERLLATALFLQEKVESSGRKFSK